ncbi:phosphatase PAP2 family protein [Mycobacterium sp. pUA109]|uniref:phosphatase PAP2 family protein n=1 Tax=Mycobacterium sp. pUA109 TaxID=3238982 RepID=UPI00351AC9A7
MRWWPPVAVAAMLLLGWAVGTGSTSVDDGFARYTHDVVGTQPRWLLAFTDWWLLGPVLTACVAAALYRRRWRLAAVVLVCPFATIAIDQALKRWFDRHNGTYLEYPSGHTALVVSVLGMVVLVTGGRRWAVAVAAVGSALGALGLIACGYHYLTDTIGAVLLASAMVCLAARVAGAAAPRGPAPPVDG